MNSINIFAGKQGFDGKLLAFVGGTTLECTCPFWHRFQRNTRMITNDHLGGSSPYENRTDKSEAETIQRSGHSHGISIQLASVDSWYKIFMGIVQYNISCNQVM